MTKRVRGFSKEEITRALYEENTSSDDNDEDGKSSYFIFDPTPASRLPIFGAILLSVFLFRTNLIYCHCFRSVLRIHDILGLIPDPDPVIFVIDLQDASKKLIFEHNFFCSLLFEGTFTSFSMIKRQKESQHSRNQGFSY